MTHEPRGSPPNLDFIEGARWAERQARQAVHVGFSGYQIADHVLRALGSLDDEYGAAVAPSLCPRCGEPYVVAGHSRGESGAVAPAWVCDRQACGIGVSWRRETEACGVRGCENEVEVAEHGGE